MAETTVIHPRLTGIWPDGEPDSVREAADTLARARRQERPVVPFPRLPEGRKVLARTKGGRPR